MQTPLNRLEKTVLNLSLIGGAIFLALTVYIGLSAMKFDRASHFTQDDKEVLETRYPGGRFISSDIYEYCDTVDGMNGRYRYWFHADGRMDNPPWQHCWK